jgi:hypothetical protein
MGATYVGVRRAHPYSWLLSSPQQPLETEDPPTVSLAPQYTSQRLCRARGFLLDLSRPIVCWESAIVSRFWNSRPPFPGKNSCRFFVGWRVESSRAAALTPISRLFHARAPARFCERRPRFWLGSHLRSSLSPAAPCPSSAGAIVPGAKAVPRRRPPRLERKPIR